MIVGVGDSTDEFIKIVKQSATSSEAVESIGGLSITFVLTVFKQLQHHTFFS